MTILKRPEETLNWITENISVPDLESMSEEFRLSELIILATRPLYHEPRPLYEQKVFQPIITARLKLLSTARSVLESIIFPAFLNSSAYKFKDIGNYFQKTEFLIERIDEIEDSILKRRTDIAIEKVKNNSPAAWREIVEYKDAFNAFSDPFTSLDRGKDLLNQKCMKTNLGVYYSPYAASHNPWLVYTKTKVLDRIGKKIGYYIIKDNRKNMKKKNITKRDGIALDVKSVGDVVGLQFVFHTREEIFSFMNHLNDLKEKHKISLVGEIENYYEEQQGPYCAVHSDWVPNASYLQFGLDSVEVIAIGKSNFLMANFGPGSYKRRAMGQDIGVVEKNLVRGALKISGYNKYEREMRLMINNRFKNIMKLA